MKWKKLCVCDVKWCKCARFAPIVGCSINLKRFYFDDLTHILPNTRSTCRWWCWKLYEIRTASISFDVNDPELLESPESSASTRNGIEYRCWVWRAAKLITGRGSNKTLTLHYVRWLADEINVNELWMIHTARERSVNQKVCHWKSPSNFNLKLVSPSKLP